jgi:hypothetical protein
LYILLGLGALVYFVRWRRARHEYLDANFELVRDLAAEKQRRMFIRWFSMFLLAISVLLIQQVVVPIALLQQEAVVTGSTIEPTFITPTLRSAGDVDIGDLVGGGGEPQFTPTVTLTPIGTLVDGVLPAEGCDSPRANLQIPVNGLRVFETIQVIGTADTENFASYKLELRGPGTSNIYAVISENTSAVADPGVLGQIVAMAFEPGDYQFRLTVFDSSNMLVAACMVNIIISTPP